MNRRRPHGALVILALALLAGCFGPPPYHPATPASAAARPASMTLSSIDFLGVSAVLPSGGATTQGLVVRVRWHADEPGTGIARALLVPPEAPPCTTGAPAELIAIDGGTRWDRPAGLGVDHEIAFGFPGDALLARGPLVLDVEVAAPSGPACLRVPIGGATQRLLPDGSVAGAFAISVFAPLGLRAQSGVGVDFAGGRWLGPVRLTLRFGLTLGGLSLTPGDDTTSSGTQQTLYGDVHVAPELAILPIVRGRRALGVSGSYVFATGWKSGTATQPEVDTDYSGPRVGLQLGNVTPAPFGAPRGRADGFGGLELWLLRATRWPGDPTSGAAYVLGLGMTLW